MASITPQASSDSTVPPPPFNEPERVRALRECDALDTAPEAEFDNLCRLAASLTRCPISYVALVDVDRQWFKARVGLAACQTSRDVAFCNHVVSGGVPLIVPDTTADKRFASSPLVVAEPFIRFYAGFPLVLGGGFTVGTFCVADVVARTLGQQQLQILTDLAAQARSQLELRRTLHQLRESEARVRGSHDLLARAHDELEIEHVRAQAAARAKRAFLTNMSHEIRTPMTAILGFTDLLTSATSDQDRARHAKVIRRNGARLLSLIDDVLEVTHLDADCLRLSSLTCDPRRTLAEIEAEAGALAREKGVLFQATCDAGVLRHIKTDPNRLRQIILYLTANAVKFTERGGGVRVVMDTLPGAAADRAVLRVRVTDTGIGIAPERLPDLFLPFAAADQPSNRRHGGTGLGLYIARRLCRLMGGDLTVESEVGRGSAFTATIEIGVEPSVVEVLAEAPRAPGRAPARETLAGARVLLVEDGPDNQRLLTSFLARAGATVSVASDGQEALDVVLQGSPGSRPALILMDMQMPRIDGYEATRRIRAAGLGLPVIALTAHAISGERERCLQAGCDEFLTKPVDRQSLVACCARWLAHAGTSLMR